MALNAPTRSRKPAAAEASDVRPPSRATATAHHKIMKTVRLDL
eukprot:CAMPEP_0195095402 /NCGR_PEP_ID=MMETSP0448-20130528/46833_1 /TAXON_ID=66468 /ORGANISM="Heterocapsa triquestra, Strain CCMP 448" /LENGTH=42 /DNA_ID= /DNA_START= /DNA_END= /DNA_ORIENTATION=